MRGVLASGVADAMDKELLKGVSRSFYLSLRMLPKPMRPAAGLGYLLARASDTIADTPGMNPDDKLRWLAHFEKAVTEASMMPAWPDAWLNRVTDPRERLLMESCPRILGSLKTLPGKEAALVREVVETIIGGQRLDLTKFSGPSTIALRDGAELEDYTWRVAGCVGLFWTRLGFATMESGFSKADPDELAGLGIRYGKGLQLVNILRDLPQDLKNGRCYLPVADPGDRAAVMDSHRAWCEIALDWTHDGIRYAGCLHGRRLRAASLLPALIAEETLRALRGADWFRLEKRIKIPRFKVYQLLLRSLLGV